MFISDHILVHCPVQDQSHHVVVPVRLRLAVVLDRLHLVVVQGLLVNGRYHLVDVRHVVVHLHQEEESEAILDLHQDLGLVRPSVGDRRRDDRTHDVHRTDLEDIPHQGDHLHEGAQDHPARHEGKFYSLSLFHFIFTLFSYCDNCKLLTKCCKFLSN